MGYIKTDFTDNVTALSAGEMNNFGTGIENATSLSKFPTAGGTATVLTLIALHFELVSGESVTFIASANNSGAATTLNVNGLGAKPVYKVGGTISPTLTAGKAYTVWFAGANFFIKASAEGSATITDVLAGKTFSNDSDSGLVGNAVLLIMNTGSIVMVQALAVRSSTAGSWVILKEAIIPYSGVVTVYYAWMFTYGSQNGYFRVCKNSTTMNTQTQTQTFSVYNGFTLDVAVVAGDHISIQYSNSIDGASMGYVKNFYIKTSLAVASVVVD